MFMMDKALTKATLKVAIITGNYNTAIGENLYVSGQMEENNERSCSVCHQDFLRGKPGISGSALDVSCVRGKKLPAKHIRGMAYQVATGVTISKEAERTQRIYEAEAAHCQYPL